MFLKTSPAYSRGPVLSDRSRVTQASSSALSASTATHLLECNAVECNAVECNAVEHPASPPLSDALPLEQAQTPIQIQGPQTQGPQIQDPQIQGPPAQKQSRLWLNLSGQDSEQLRSLASDSTVQTRLRQSSVAGVYLSLDVAQDVLETWAGACLASGKPSFILVPQAQQVFARQRNSWKWHFKRLGDRLVAALLLLLLSPLMIVLAILVKCSSSGPVFFRQWRVGQQGQLFRIFKFRTMGAGAERQHHQVMGQQQGLNKCENDPRVTWVGRWMRKSSLDELPQLFNVITGEMSLVGPRPWALYDAVQIRPSDRHRLRALPGITGLWQVSGRSQLLDIDRVTGLDLQYIKTWSLRNDLKILLMTFPSVILGRGAC